MGHKLFAVLADHLTRNGFIVLRVDDRGVGKSSGSFSQATSADFATDVANSLAYLLSRSEVNKKKVGLIGHSEGGMIAPMVAAQRKDIDFIILLAGPGVKIVDLMVEQNAAILRSSDISENAINAYKPLYKKLVSQITIAPDTAIALVTVKKTINDWADKTDNTALKELGMVNIENRNAIAKTLVQGIYNPWFKYFLAFDPAVYLKKLNTKVLALNGNRDIQVISKQNLPAIKAALKKSKSKNVTIIEMPGLNHLFQTCKDCTLEEYGQLEETFSPAALKVISDWLEKNVK
jgi:pimeloyl-ACP methyl ester carboxylesterase